MKLRTVIILGVLAVGALVYRHVDYVLSQPPGSCVRWFGRDKACDANQALSYDTLQKIGTADPRDPVLKSGLDALHRRPDPPRQD